MTIFTPPQLIYPGIVPVRQTILQAPVDSTGFPNFLPSTASGLTLTTQNISASNPLIVTAANGAFKNVVGIMTSNASFPGLGNGATVYLLASINETTNAMTLSYAGLAPIYQWGGTPSTTNGQYTYNISENQMYYGNGSTAIKVDNIVFLGQVTTSGGNITAASCYPIQGVYQSPEISLSTGADYAYAHGFGATPFDWSFSLRNKTADLGWSPNDEIMAHVGDAGTANSQGAYANATFVGYRSISGYIPPIANKSSGANATISTPANWRGILRARRGWGGA